MKKIECKLTIRNGDFKYQCTFDHPYHLSKDWVHRAGHFAFMYWADKAWYKRRKIKDRGKMLDLRSPWEYGYRKIRKR